MRRRLRVELDVTDIDVLVAKKYLAEADHDDLDAIQEAANMFILGRLFRRGGQSKSPVIFSRASV